MPFVDIFWDEIIPEFIGDSKNDLGQRLILEALVKVNNRIDDIEEELNNRVGDLDEGESYLRTQGGE